MSMINGTHTGVDDGETREDEADGDDEIEGEQHVEPPEPTDRASFNLLRQSFDSSYSMIESFLKDHGLHIKTRMIILAGTALRVEFMESLNYQAQGQYHMMVWQARRAAGSWFASIPRLLNLLDSPEVGEKLDVRAIMILDNGDPRHAVLRGHLERFTRFVMELCHARCWSQLHHSFCLPNAFARIFVETQRERYDAQQFFQGLTECLVELERLKEQHPRNAALKSFIDAIGTWEWPLFREILALGIQEDWNPSSQKLRSLAWSIFAGPAESKSSCENAFNWLQDAALRQSKAPYFSGVTKYMYLMTCPYARAGGCNVVVPLLSDFADMDTGDFKVRNHQKFRGTTATATLSKVTLNNKLCINGVLTIKNHCSQDLLL